MQTRALKYITWLWIGSLFIATVGVSVQQIYCYCMGKTTFALFSAVDACATEQDNNVQDCCAKPARTVHGCCDKQGKPSPDHGCTKKSTKVFQLKTEFTAQKESSGKVSVESLDHAFLPVSFAFSFNVFGGENIVFQPFAEPPPPISGRMICVRHGVFRC